MFKIGPIPDARVVFREDEIFLVEVEGRGIVKVELKTIKRLPGCLITIADDYDSTGLTFEEDHAALQTVREYLVAERAEAK